MSSNTRGLIVSLIAIAVALLSWQLWRSRAPAAASAPLAAEAQTPRPSPIAPPAQADAAGKIEPIRDDYRNPQLAEIKNRADAGDSRASCQLGMELLRCTDTSAAEQMLAAAEENARPDLPPDQRGYMTKLENRARRILAECRNAPADSWKQGNHYLRQAALAGEPEAMYRYARGDSVLIDYSHMSTPEFDRWRAEAGNMMQLSFEAGYLPSVFDLMVAYSDDSSPLTGMIANDPTKARAMRLLISRLAGKPADRPESRYASLEPAATALASQWQRDYFPTVKPPIEKLPRVMPAGFASLYADEGTEAPPCSQ
ncbi:MULTISPECIES: hypothetical protein [Lysobacter]|uniref:Sel1 repeat family protein n=1 Tax=Lysobacter gummosus TaxID=262324 RepID=A0ABY3XG61_9GAMM|nr:MULTISPECIES: hypothetical protein [Lysobacter]ALN90061.1 hypothetical protein LG3211_1085 [Lysobacter gummosus]UJB18088.1 hypothetical protein L1A79_17255 [Lysobacter capsici]UJQ28189.1 hypothetical protein L2D09_22630 [Lysobacter gummosus]UNP30633.1 hypothetical protein MOV92_05050 [Lysobacter gummosus]